MSGGLQARHEGTPARVWRLSNRCLAQAPVGTGTGRLQAWQGAALFEGAWTARPGD